MALELDVIGYRLDEVLYLGGGGGIGWMNFTGKTRDTSGAETSEDTSFEVVPLNLVAVLRLDVLPRKLGIPFIFAGKLGYQWAHWTAKSGGREDASGWSLGLVYGAQVALDLDTFEPSAARKMDEGYQPLLPLPRALRLRARRRLARHRRPDLDRRAGLHPLTTIDQ
jgi:hypothetical protein